MVLHHDSPEPSSLFFDDRTIKGPGKFRRIAFQDGTDTNGAGINPERVPESRP
jgi:hypothetical protein